MGDIFLYPVIFAVALWTARLAISKGRNPWGWGGAALLLSLVNLPESALLGVVPVLALLFIKRPATDPAAQPDRLSCARCAKPYSAGQHFCTGCGWDLSETYSPEEQDGAQASPAQTQTTVPSTAVAQPPEKAEVSAAEPPATKPPVSEPETAEVSSAPATESGQGPVDETDQSPEAEPAEAEPETEHVPWGTFEPGIAPTAAVMTSRGIERFDEGKYQEAIDQFTKAIALDPNYADAWQRRAEAYAQLGRSEQAAEDRRHLQGLDPSSSPG